MADKPYGITPKLLKLAEQVHQSGLTARDLNGLTRKRIELLRKVEENKDVLEWASGGTAASCWLVFDCENAQMIGGVYRTRSAAWLQARTHYNSTNHACYLYEGDIGGDHVTQRARYPTTTRKPKPQVEP
jgi:hypothetical protein